MSGVNILFLILAMAAVTYIPRAVPAVLIEKIKLNKKAEKFLKLIPYTAMSALIFPGVLTVDPENPAAGILGAAAAAVLAWFKCPVMVCVLAAIAADFVLYLII